jgi:Tfp pilus assembly protein PilO
MTISDLLFNFSKLDEKNRSYLLGGLCLLIFVADYFLILGPLQLKPLRNLSPKIQALQKDLKQAEQNIQGMEQFRQELQRLKGKWAELNAKVRTYDDIPVILDRVTRIAQEVHLSIDQIMPLKEEEVLLSNEQGQYLSLSIVMEARGGYHDIGRFLSRLEANDIFFRANDFQLSANEKDSKRHYVKMTIKTVILKK